MPDLQWEGAERPGVKVPGLFTDINLEHKERKSQWKEPYKHGSPFCREQANVLPWKMSETDTKV